MKRIILTAALLLTAAVSQAQLTWDVRLGANVSGIENSDAKMRLGLKLGGGVDYAFSDAFSLRPMLYYSSKGVSQGKSNLGFFPNTTTALNYLQLPVMVSYHIRLNDNLSLAANAGPYAAWLVSHTANPAVQYNTFDAGIGAGLDLHIRRMVIGLEAEYGLTSLSSNVSGMHNINYSLLVGYRF